MKTRAFPARWAAALMTGALLTMVFASGCQTSSPEHPKVRTIHVPPGGMDRSHESDRTIVDIRADGSLKIPANTTAVTPVGNTIRIPAGSTINVPRGSTIHVPPGGNGANDVSKDRPRHRRHRHHDPEIMTTAPAPPGITHPGG